MTLTLPCPAKVNLALSVGPPQVNGYHPIASWMVAIEFADTLCIEHATGTTSKFDINFADDAPQPQPINWAIENDLAFRAHQLLETHTNKQLPIHAKITKRIPAGAGLGGGSSDAAGMLVGLNQLFGLGLSNEALLTISQTLGSDVAFAVSAIAGECPSAIVTSFGESLESAPRKQPINLVLVLPPLQCPTAAVYKTFDDINNNQSVDEIRVRSLAQSGAIVSGELFNNLAQPAMHVEPKLRQAFDDIKRATHFPVHITGSGAAMFLVGDSPATADALAIQITQATALPAVATRSLI